MREGILKTIKSAVPLLRVGFFNIFLGQLHRKMYSNIPVEEIIKYLKKKKYKLICREVLYNGFDELVIFRKNL